MSQKLNVLLIYKKSSYTIYFYDNRKDLSKIENHFRSKEVYRFKQTHETHHASIASIEKVLRRRKISYVKRIRGGRINFADFNLIITVGGDGTFLEASRQVREQMILGINSDPSWSVGRFCYGRAQQMEEFLDAIATHKQQVTEVNRLQVRFLDNKEQDDVIALNDVLICHKNPAAMCRYELNVNNVVEAQRSSGVWVATAAGSTGAIHSAGGDVIPMTSAKIQYKPRELYLGKNTKYKLQGKVLSSSSFLELTSLIRGGRVFADGSHFEIPLTFGSRVRIENSKYPLKIITGINL